MKVEVISLGGSLLFRDGVVDHSYLEKLKELLMNFKDRKFVIVVGGGSVARTYIKALERFDAGEEFLAHFGIAITRTNARMVANAFGSVANKRTLPKSLKVVRNLLGKHKVVCCGGLRYEKNQTSDGTAAQIACYLKTRFINITNVKGLYDKDPNKYGDAEFISEINYADFKKLVGKIKYKPGQHFVLDQHAASIIQKHKIETYIVGKNLTNLRNLFKGKKFVGTFVC